MTSRSASLVAKVATGSTAAVLLVVAVVVFSPTHRPHREWNLQDLAFAWFLAIPPVVYAFQPADHIGRSPVMKAIVTVGFIVVADVVALYLLAVGILIA